MDVLDQISSSARQDASCLHCDGYILDWIAGRNSNVSVSVERCGLSEMHSWFYDKAQGRIRNSQSSFFQVSGLRHCIGGKDDVTQPIILQNEIGFLGIIAKSISGSIHFLMQGKIEPGNINKVQLSPTVQATKSNFMQMHGGRRPEYLDYFMQAKKFQIVVDQIQSEQASRFFKKRNRNMLIVVEDEVPIKEGFIWVNVGQLKRLLRRDNLVNMDTRTVLSGIPFSGLSNVSSRLPSRRFALNPHDFEVERALNALNDRKMFLESESRLISLNELEGWDISDYSIKSVTPYEFEVIFASISIEGREVRSWDQPLFAASGRLTIAAVVAKIRGELRMLVRLVSEPGNFDGVEFGPTVQYHPSQRMSGLDGVEQLALMKCEDPQSILYDVILSEEGGRFFHEENRNVIVEVSAHEVADLSGSYQWMTLGSLWQLIRFGSTVNIQLRNLVSLIEFE